MKKTIIVVLCLLTISVWTQTTIQTGTNINTFSAASEGDVYKDNDDNIYIGLEDGTLKMIPKDVSESLPNGVESITVSKPLLWLDTTSFSVTSDSDTYPTAKSFTLKGGVLNTANAVRITCWRRRVSGNLQVRFRYGGQTLFTSGSLGNNSAKMEFIIFASGTTNSQRAYMDDANTGGNGEQTGTSTVDSTTDNDIEIGAIRSSNNGTANIIDFCSAEALIYN